MTIIYFLLSFIVINMNQDIAQILYWKTYYSSAVYIYFV